MNAQEIKETLLSMSIGSSEPIEGMTVAVRTSEDRWCVYDNGEEVENLMIENAVQIVLENLANEVE